MSEDVILDETADFIRSNKTNLELALHVERAMPRVRGLLVKDALEAMEEHFKNEGWDIEGKPALEDVMAGYAHLELMTLKRKDWSATRIVLGAGKQYWNDVWISLYFDRQYLKMVQCIEQEVELLTKSGFNFDADDGPCVWKLLDAELRDWSDETFLTKLFDKDGLEWIASEISSELKVIDKFVNCRIDQTKRGN